jgi:hypothetical protein
VLIVIQFAIVVAITIATISVLGPAAASSHDGLLGPMTGSISQSARSVAVGRGGRLPACGMEIGAAGPARHRRRSPRCGRGRAPAQHAAGASGWRDAGCGAMLGR